MLRLAVIGVGYWGTKLARVAAATPGAQLVAVVDSDADRRAAAASTHPGVRMTADPHEVALAPGIDAVVIATPAATHAALAHDALAAGKHVLVEKPLAIDPADADRLVAVAARMRQTLMVDHTFVYAGAVRRLRELLGDGAIGEVLAVESTRTNLARFHPDIGVAWDLAVHDLAILDYLLGPATSEPLTSTLAIEPGGTPDVAHLSRRHGRCLAHVHVSWLTAVKVRRMVFTGTLGTIVYDGLDAATPLRVYEGGPASAAEARASQELRTGFQAGRMWTPVVPTDEPLATMVAHFVECVTRGTTPLTDGAVGARVVRAVAAVAPPAVVRADAGERAGARP